MKQYRIENGGKQLVAIVNEILEDALNPSPLRRHFRGERQLELQYVQDVAMPHSGGYGEQFTQHFIITKISIGDEGRIDFTLNKIDSYVSDEPIDIDGWYLPDTDDGTLFIPETSSIVAST